MFRRMSLKALYEQDDELSLMQRISLTLVWNVCPVVVFIAAFWAFKTWVWNDQPVTVVWK